MTVYYKTHQKLHNPKDETVLIEAEYRIGGHNWYNGKMNPRCMALSFTRMMRCELTGSTTIELGGNGNFFIAVCEVARDNRKRGEALADFVRAHENELTRLYAAGDRKALYAYVAANYAGFEGVKAAA